MEPTETPYGSNVRIAQVYETYVYEVTGGHENSGVIVQEHFAEANLSPAVVEAGYRWVAPDTSVPYRVYDAGLPLVKLAWEFDPCFNAFLHSLTHRTSRMKKAVSIEAAESLDELFDRGFVALTRDYLRSTIENDDPSWYALYTAQWRKGDDGPQDGPSNGDGNGGGGPHTDSPWFGPLKPYYGLRSFKFGPYPQV